MSTADFKRPDHPLLIVFGCSWTVGEWLPGFELSPYVFSKLSWPSLLSITMNIKLMNMARGGNGNRQIFYNILDFSKKHGFRNDDIVVVCWSFAGRELLLDTSYENQCTRTWNIRESARAEELPDNRERIKFYEVHSMNDLEIRSREYVHHTELFLQSKNVRYKMGQIERWLERNSNWQIYNADDFPLFEQIDYASDNAHPGVESNKLFFQKMYKELNA